MKILITGGNGYVAQSLVKGLSSSLYDITWVTREDFDLTNKEATDKWFNNKYFDVIIHTAIKGGSRLKPDTEEVFYQNLQMFYNLYYNKPHFGKLIQFGSGAELGQPTTPYGLSKKIIKDICDTEDKFYNIRIFAVFDENELDTRFIKSNIKRYINKESIEIHQNKLMDFFYMEDLIKVVEYYINNEQLIKNIDCSYIQKYSLLDIANIINNLSNYKVDIVAKTTKAKDYVGKFNLPDLKWIGIEKGIKNTYKKLLDETN